MDEIYLFPVNDYRDYLQHHGVKGQKWGVRNAEWYPIAAYQKSKGISGPGPNKASARVSSGRSATRAKGTGGASENRVNPVGSFLNRMKQRKEEKAKAEAEAKKKADQKARMEKARAAKEEKKRTEEEERKRQEEKRVFEQEKREVFSHGTVEEILSYANKADSKEITDAIARRQALDKLLNDQAAASRGNTKVKQIVENIGDKVIPVANRVIPIADKVASAADSVTNAITKSEKAYSAVKKTLVNLGLISPSAAKSSDAVVAAARKYQNTKEYAQAIYDQVMSGKIKTTDITNYQKQLEALKSIEKTGYSQPGQNVSNQKPKKGEGSNQQGNDESGGKKGGSSDDSGVYRPIVIVDSKPREKMTLSDLIQTKRADKYRRERDEADAKAAKKQADKAKRDAETAASDAKRSERTAFENKIKKEAEIYKAIDKLVDKGADVKTLLPVFNPNSQSSKNSFKQNKEAYKIASDLVKNHNPNLIAEVLERDFNNTTEDKVKKWLGLG